MLENASLLFCYDLAVAGFHAHICIILVVPHFVTFVFLMFFALYLSFVTINQTDTSRRLRAALLLILPLRERVK